MYKYTPIIAVSSQQPLQAALSSLAKYQSSVLSCVLAPRPAWKGAARNAS